MTQETIVLGGGPIGVVLATELVAPDHTVTFVDDEQMVSRARTEGLTARESSLETAPDLGHSASTVVVATPSDARNLLLASGALHRFDADTVIALLNDPENEAAFDDAGVDTICVATVLSRSTADVVTAEDESEARVTRDPTETVSLRE